MNENMEGMENEMQRTTSAEEVLVNGEMQPKTNIFLNIRAYFGKLHSMSFDLWNNRFWKKSHRNIYGKRLQLKFLSVLATLVLVGVIGGFLCMTILFAWYAKDLPQPGKLTNRDISLSTKIFDRNGILLYDVYGDKNRTWANLTQIPKYLQKATIATEDKDFYKHQGFDPKGILRSVFQILVKHDLQGGSTLTQQVIKNTLLSQERTLPRKIKEFILAVQVERKYTKDQILELYLNEAPYGGTAWGVEAASETYFGKKVNNLNLLECAILAGLPQSPTSYSPFGSNPTAFKRRTQAVLRRMREDGQITRDQEQKALKDLELIKFAPQGTGIKAPHFVMYVKEKLVQEFGEKAVETGGLQVTTTLDYELELKAEKIVKDEVDKMKNYKVGNGAAVVLDPRSGEILAMVGSKDYFAKDYDGNFNAALGLRQPGSSIKPITYATAFMRGYTPASILLDVETHFAGADNLKDYIPQNYDGKFRGPVQVRFALANSMNIPAVKMLANVGVKDMLTTAYDMGLTTLEPTAENLRKFGLAVTLGGGESRLLDMTSAFGVFGNQGVRYTPTAILKVTDSKGKLLKDYKKGTGKKVLTPEVSFLISHILLDDNARSIVFGRGSYLVVPGKTVSVKTGTTEDKKDNWTIGFTPSRAVGVWVGNNDNTKMSQYVESGASGAAPIWNKIMKEALLKIHSEEPKKPDMVTAVEVDTLTGGLPKDNNNKRTEYFIKGTEPQAISPIYKKLKISKANGKLANDAEIIAGDFEEKEYIVFEERDPVSSDGKNRWQESWDAYINTVEPFKSDWHYHPPKDVSDAKTGEVTVRFQAPGDRSQVNDHDVEVIVKATSTKGIKRMTLEVDGTQKIDTGGSSIKEKVNMADGTHSIKVKAWDNDNRTGDAEIHIGVNVAWDYKPSPTPEPTAAATATPIPSPTPTPTH